MASCSPVGIFLHATAKAVAVVGLFAASATHAAVVPGYAVVRTKPGFGKAGSVARRHSLKVVKSVPQLDASVVAVGSGSYTSRLLSVASDPDVASVAPLRRIELADVVPADPFLSQQYHVSNFGQSGGTPGADLKLQQAWSVTLGTTSTVLAITDTGTELGHPDLAGRLWTNSGEIAGNLIDDDGNGYVDDVLGWNTVTDSGVLNAVLGHGTNVAGTAAAATNNGIGTAGVDWNCRIMTVQMFGADGSATDADAAQAVVYAASNGAHIINASWGASDESDLIADAIRFAASRGSVVVAAAGNDGICTDLHPFFPAAMSNDFLVSVGGSDRNDALAFNFGQRSVDVAAPAVSVFQPRFGSTYGTGSGTSYAAPQISGIIGLIRAARPTLTPDQYKYVLSGSADKLSAFTERNAGAGRGNAQIAVSTLDAAAPSAIQDLAVNRVGWNGAILTWTAPGDDGQVGTAARYLLRVTTGSLSAGTFATAPAAAITLKPDVAGTRQWWVLNDLEPDTSYSVALRAADDAGNLGAVSSIVSIRTSAWPLTVFADDCNSTGTWSANGFTLAPGLAFTGALTWQDSPGADYLPGANATITGTSITLSSLARPAVSFRLRHLLPNTNDRVDGFFLEGSDDGINYRVLAPYTGSSAPTLRRTVLLDELGTGTARLRFRLAAGGDSVLSDGVYIDDIRVHDLGDAVPISCQGVVEARDWFDAPGKDVVTSGPWTAGTLKSRAPGVEGFRGLVVGATSPASTRFGLRLPGAGRYALDLTHSSSVAGTGVRVRVAGASGVSESTLDQTTVTADQWNSLGNFLFPDGTNPAFAFVEIDAGASVGGSVQADSVRWRWLSPAPAARMEEWQAW